MSKQPTGTAEVNKIVAVAAVTVVALWLLWALYGADLVLHLVKSRHATADLAHNPPAAEASAAGASAAGASAVAASTTERRSAATPAENPLLELAHVGDIFGGINALFASLALVGVGWAALLQRQAIADAQAAFENERTENEFHRELSQRSQFDAKFFQLVALLNSNQQALRLSVPNHVPRTLEGSDVIEHVADEIYQSVNLRGRQLDLAQVKADTLDYAGQQLGLRYLSRMGPYLNTLVEVFTQIGDAGKFLDAAERLRYASLARAQISRAARTVLAIRCLATSDRRLADVIERYALLDELAPRHAELFLPMLKASFRASAFNVGTV